jgi:hypothetical protein
MPFADAEPPYRIAREIELYQAFGAVRPQVAVYSALHNREQKLIGITMAIPAYTRPAYASFNSGDKPLLRAWKRRAFVKAHNNIGAQAVLHIRRDTRIDINPASVYVAGKFHAVITNPVECAQRKHLITAAVRKYRAMPCHKFVQAAQRLDGINARAYHQMVSVGKYNLRAGFRYLQRRKAFYRASGAYGHKNRRFKCAVGSGKRAETGAAACIGVKYVKFSDIQNCVTPKNVRRVQQPAGT